MKGTREILLKKDFHKDSYKISRCLDMNKLLNLLTTIYFHLVNININVNINLYFDLFKTLR